MADLVIRCHKRDVALSLELAADLTMQSLLVRSENSISMAFVVMCAEKIRRLLRLFFVTILAWIYACQREGFLWMALRRFFSLKQKNCPSLHSRSSELPTALFLGWNQSVSLEACSGVPTHPPQHQREDKPVDESVATSPGCAPAPRLCSSTCLTVVERMGQRPCVGDALELLNLVVAENQRRH